MEKHPKSYVQNMSLSFYISSKLCTNAAVCCSCWWCASSAQPVWRQAVSLGRHSRSCRRQRWRWCWRRAPGTPAGAAPAGECSLSSPRALAAAGEETVPCRMMGFHFCAFLKAGTSLETHREWTLEEKETLKKSDNMAAVSSQKPPIYELNPQF